MPLPTTARLAATAPPPRRGRALRLLCLSAAFVLSVCAGVALHGVVLAEGPMEVSPERTLRVGVFEHPPEVVLRDGRVEGLAAEVLQTVAAREGWRLEYVTGDAGEILQQARRGTLDVLPVLCPAMERAGGMLRGAEAVALNWAVVYGRRGLQLPSLLDLENQRVALPRMGYPCDAFRQHMEEYGLTVEYREVASQQEAMEAVERGECDAAVVSRLYGDRYGRDFQVDRTPIVFGPHALTYGAPARHDEGRAAALLAVVDARLAALKADAASPYGAILERWTDGPEGARYWRSYAAPGLLTFILLAAGGIVLHRRLLRGAAQESGALRRRLAQESRGRLAAELDSHEHKRILQSSFDAIQDLVVVLDRNMRVVFSNWKGMEHVPHEVRRSKPICYVCFYGVTEACDQCPGRAIFETGETHVFEQVSPTGDRLLEISMHPVKDRGGRVIFSVEHVRDITQRRRQEEALRRSETRLRNVIDNAPIVFWTMDNEGVLTFHEGRGLRRLGLEPGAFVGRSIFDVFGRSPQVLQAASSALQGKSVSTILEHGGHAFEVRYTPIFDEARRLVETVGVALDITERMDAEREILRARYILDAHLSNSPLGVVEWDDAFRVTRWSGSAEAILGWSAEQAEGRHPSELAIVFEEDRDEVAAAMENLLSGQVKGCVVRNRNITREGRVICCDWHNSVLLDEEGSLVSILSLVEDVTEAWRASQELQYAKDSLEETVAHRTRELQRAIHDISLAKSRTETILASVADGLVVTDNENYILGLNLAAEAILGLSPIVLGEKLEHVIEDRGLREQLSSNIRKANRYDSYQFELTLPNQVDGAPMYVQARTAVIKSGVAGAQSGVILSLRDVTVEKAVDRMKTEFISTAAHELRTPLTAIQGFSEILLTRRPLTTEQTQRYLRFIHKHAEGLGSIINDLLDISRIESGHGFSFTMRPYALNDVARRKVEEHQASAKDHVLRFEPSEATFQVEGDASRMEQLLDNLLSNAVKYSPAGGEVCVRVSAPEVAETSDASEAPAGTIVLSVADQGVGIKPEQLEHVFEKFYRAHANDGAIPGTGLGMSIVKHIVEAHHGTVHIESEPDVGTTVIVTLPRTQHTRPSVGRAADFTTTSPDASGVFREATP